MQSKRSTRVWLVPRLLWTLQKGCCFFPSLKALQGSKALDAFSSLDSSFAKLSCCQQPQPCNSSSARTAVKSEPQVAQGLLVLFLGPLLGLLPLSLSFLAGPLQASQDRVSCSLGNKGVLCFDCRNNLRAIRHQQRTVHRRPPSLETRPSKNCGT